MEKEVNVPSAGKEMSFFDLCVQTGRAIGRGCAFLGRILGRMVRLTYRYWWLVLTVVVLAIAAALYYTRKGNTIFKVEAVAFLNGPSIQQFEQAYTSLRSGQMLPDGSNLQAYVWQKRLRKFETFRVVDCYNDSTADYIDFKRKSSPVDTIEVQMKDRLCIRFNIKSRDLHLLPEIEQDLLAFLNSNEAMQRSYEAYMKDLQQQVAFNHSQVQKLDSLTTHYYFNAHHGDHPLSGMNTGMVWVGDWRIHLFLNEIYDHQARTERMDQRMELATAPVVLENHLAVNPEVVNERKKCLAVFILFGWCCACALAELIDKRKALNAWLKA